MSSNCEFPAQIHSYRPICRSGTGAFGAVWLVKDAVGKRYALKVVYKLSLGSDWKREFHGLEQYQNQVTAHPNLIRIFHIEDAPDFFYYTMECADNLCAEFDTELYQPATLANRLRREPPLSATEVREMFDQLLDGLEHLHEAGLVHRDVKPDNIVFVNGVPKLGDIGLVSTTSQTLSLAGTRDFIPPEYLTGQKKLPNQEIDIYALGKTLFCAFSGQEPDRYPLLPRSILKEPGKKQLNDLAKRACAVEPLMRLKTIREFRLFLHGRAGWGYEFIRLFRGLYLLLRFPVVLVCLAIRFLISRKWILILLGLLILGWLGMVLKALVRLEKVYHPYEYGIHADTLKLAFSTWHLPFSGHDLYDFYKKDDFSLKHYGERRLVTREEYLRAKNFGIPSQSLDMGLEIEIGDPEEAGGKVVSRKIVYPTPDVTQDTPLDGEYLHELCFRGVRSPEWSVPSGTEWQGGVMTLPAVRRGVLKFQEELPLRSEIRLSFDPSDFCGTLEFYLTAAEYVPVAGRPVPETQIRRQLRFRMRSTGGLLVFEPALYREQDRTEDELAEIGDPKTGAVERGERFCELRILFADHCRRVYLNGTLVWATFPAFFGGFFEMRYRSEAGSLRINDFAVYDTGIVQPGEKRESRLSLPARRELRGSGGREEE